jgi:hypothetical protein
VAGSNIGIGAAPADTNLYVLGNSYISNALTTSNIFTTNVNVAGTTNTLTLIATSNIGIGITPSGANLYVQGNVFISNALTATNVIATGNISYNEDITKRGPFLTPDPSNAATIQAWISATCNAAGQPTKSWWATSNVPVYGNVATGPQGTSEYGGPVLLPDGRVLFVPQNASNIGFFNPGTGLFSTVSPTGLPATTNKFRGGVVVPNGNVVFIPWNLSNVGLFNPVSYQYSNIQVGAAGAGNNLKFQGGVLGPTGNVIMVPRDSANIAHFNPTTLAMTNVGPIAAQGLSLFGAGALLPNGNLVMAPLSSGNIGMYNTYSMTTAGFTNVGPIGTTYTWETAVLTPNGNVVFPPSTATNVMTYNPTFVSNPIGAGGVSNITMTSVVSQNWFQGGTLLPSGNVIFCPTDISNVGMYDPVAVTYSNSTAVHATASKFFGCTLIPDGRVVFSPLSSTNVGVINTLVPAPREFCQSPFFNKY